MIQRPCLSDAKLRVSRHSFGPNGVKWTDPFILNTALFHILLIAVCYKLVPIGIGALLGLSINAYVYRANLNKINATMIVALLYIADATTTAFFVSRGDGIARTIQFIIISAGLIGIFAYSFELNGRKIDRFVTSLFMLCVFILFHIVEYHVSIQKFVAWKYLFDTKLAFSLTAFLLFSAKDALDRRHPSLFYLLLPALTAIIFLSGERKALGLVLALFLVSNIALERKALIGGLFVLAAGFALGGPGATSLETKMKLDEKSYGRLPDRYFYSVSALGDQSDLIREFVNRNARQLFMEHPVVGIGATGYSRWAHAHFPSAQGMTMNVHGEVNRVPVEGGLIGIMIAIAYLTAIFCRSIHFAFRKTGQPRSSLDSAPFYLAIFVVTYCYAEATDTYMLLLIGMAGVTSARLPAFGLNTLIRGRFVRRHPRQDPPRGLLRGHANGPKRRRIRAG